MSALLLAAGPTLARVNAVQMSTPQDLQAIEIAGKCEQLAVALGRRVGTSVLVHLLTCTANELRHGRCALADDGTDATGSMQE